MTNRKRYSSYRILHPVSKRGLGNLCYSSESEQLCGSDNVCRPFQGSWSPTDVLQDTVAINHDEKRFVMTQILLKTHHSALGFSYCGIMM